MSINAIKINLSRTSNVKSNLNKEISKKEEKAPVQSKPQEQNSISAEDVFKYMSMTSVKTKTNVNAYINYKSATRISNSIKDFEKQFTAKLASVNLNLGTFQTI